MKLFFRAVESILTCVYQLSLGLLVVLMIGTWMNACSSPPAKPPRVLFEEQQSPPVIRETGLWRVKKFFDGHVTCYVIEPRGSVLQSPGISCLDYIEGVNPLKP